MQARVLAGLGREGKINTKITLFWVVRPDPSELTSKGRLGMESQHKVCSDLPYTHRSRHITSRSCKYSEKTENCVTQITAIAKYHKPYLQMDDLLSSTQDYREEWKEIIG